MTLEWIWDGEVVCPLYRRTRDHWGYAHFALPHSGDPVVRLERLIIRLSCNSYPTQTPTTPHILIGCVLYSQISCC